MLKPWQAAMYQALLAATTLLMLYPVLIMVLSAFKPTAEIYASPFALPSVWNFANIETIWRETRFLAYLGNSVLVTVASIALMLASGTLAAYALARYAFRGNEAIYLFFLAGLMVPLKLAIIPLFIELKTLDLIDSRLGLVLVYAAMGLPSTVFIMAGFLKTIPAELEEAARIDGASEAKILGRIMIPLSRPALVIAGIHNAVPIWNDFFFPLVLIQSDHAKTLPQGLTVFMGEYSIDWGVLFAGLTLSALPLTLVYIALSRQFIAGLTSGAVKG